MEMIIPSSKSLSFCKPCPLFTNVNLLNPSPTFFSYATKTLTPKPIVYAIRKRRRSGSRKRHSISLESLAQLASSLRVLPEPFDFVIREFAGGNGGNFGFRNWFGGGGSDGTGARKLGFWVILVASGFLLCCVILDGGKGRNLAWAVPIFLVMVVYCLGRGSKRELRSWLLGFCCGASTVGVGLGLQSEDWVRLSDKFRARSSGPVRAILGKINGRRR